MLVADVFEEIQKDFDSDELTLPSLPDIALRVHKAAANPNCTFDSIGRVLKSDAALSAHLVRMANSPRYMSRFPATNVRMAVHRIGVPGVRTFATSFALKNLFHSYNKGLNRLFREVWEDSCEISAITAVLATFCAGFDPDDALLAGLLQDVGIVVLLGQLAERGDDLADVNALRSELDEWAPRIGVRLLESWEFDQRYLDVAGSRHDWRREGSDKADLADLVTLARMHRYIISGRRDLCPQIDSVPAYRKLPVGQLTAETSLKILAEANEEIEKIRAMLRD